MRIGKTVLFERRADPARMAKFFKKMNKKAKAELVTGGIPEVPPQTSKQARKLRAKKLQTLQDASLKVPLLHSAWRIRSRLPIKQGYKLEGGDSNAIDACNTLGKNSGLDQKLMYLNFARDALGHSCLENVFWKGSKPVDIEKAYVDFVPAETVDYERDTLGNIIYSGGRPKGYVQHSENYGDPKKLGLERLAFDWYNPFGGYEPVSLTECLYKSAERMLNAMDGYSAYVRKKGFPFYTAKTGTPDYPPSESDWNEIESAFEDFDSANDYFIFPWMVDVQMEDVGSVRDLIHVADPFIDEICSLAGIPKPFLVGSAMGTELATSRAQIDILLDTMTDLQFKNARFVENQIFKPFCMAHGFEDVPKVVFKPIDLRDLKDLSQSIRLLLGESIQAEPAITAEEAREALGGLINIHDETKPKKPEKEGQVQ